MKSSWHLTKKAHRGATPRARRGFALATVVVFIFVITLMGLGMLRMAAFEGDLYKTERMRRQALFLADAGAQRALAKLSVTDDWTTLAGSLYGSVPLGGGTYTVGLTDVTTSSATITSEGAYLDKTRTVEVMVTR